MPSAVDGYISVWSSADDKFVPKPLSAVAAGQYVSTAGGDTIAGDLRINGHLGINITPDAAYRLKISGDVRIVGTLTADNLVGTAGVDASSYKGNSSPSAAEFSYLAGVGSAIQPQIDSKAALAGATFTGAVAVKATDTVNNNVTDVLTVSHNVSNTPTTNMGVGLAFNMKASTTLDATAARIAAHWSTASFSVRSSYLSFSLVNNASALTEYARIQKGTTYFLSDTFYIGATTNPGGAGNNSKVLIYGGSGGANLDIMGNASQLDQATVELESADYEFTLQSFRMQYYGTSGVGTTYGVTNTNLGVLGWQSAAQALIGTDNTTPIRFFINSTERMRLGSGLMVGTTTDPGAGVLNLGTGLRIGNAATSGQYLRGNGTSFVSSAVQAGDISGLSVAWTAAHTFRGGFLVEDAGTGADRIYVDASTVQVRTGTTYLDVGAEAGLIVGGKSWLASDSATNSFTVGDVAGWGNGSHLSVEDDDMQIRVRAETVKMEGGYLELGVEGAMQGMLAIKAASLGSVSVQAAASGADWILTLPSSGGTNRYPLLTNGFGTTSWSQLAASDLSNGTTGSGAVVLATSPSLVTPSLGAATATTINKVTITQPATSATLTIANGKTLTVSNTLTLAGTDSKSLTLTGSLTVGADTSITGGGALALATFTATVPATGTVAMGAGTLTVSTLNATGSANHTHALDVTTAGAASKVLATDTNSKTTLAGLLALNATFDLVNSGATTVNFAGAATALSMGAATGTATINNAALALGAASVTTTQSTLALFNSTVTTLNLGGAATAINVGAATGTFTVSNPTVNLNASTVASNSATLNLFNSTVTTLNFGGAATALAMGNAAGTTTLNSGTVSLTGTLLGAGTGYTTDIGQLSKKFRSLYAAELFVETLVAVDTQATMGGRWLVGTTTQLIADVTTGATTIDVKHNNLLSGDRVRLEAQGKAEWIAITSNATVITGGFRYSVTRNLDGTGANAWDAGSSVFSTGQAGSGYWDVFSINSSVTVAPDFIFNYNNTGAAYSTTNYATYSGWQPFGDGANTEVNDTVYFGVQNKTWSNLYFNLTTAAAYTATLVWEYWNGSAWTSFVPTFVGNTSGDFKATGWQGFEWGSLSGWAASSVNSQTAFWVRVRISAFTSWTTLPTQFKRVYYNKGQVGPTQVLWKRNSSTWNDVTEHAAFGELAGFYGYGASTTGVALGEYAAGKAHVTLDSTNGLRFFSGLSTVNSQWDTSGNITLGQVAAGQPNLLLSAGSVSVRNNTTTQVLVDSGGVLVGQAASGQCNVQITSGNLNLRVNTTTRIGLTTAGVLTINDSAGTAAITLDASAGIFLNGKMQVSGAGAAFALGTTPPTSATAGTGIWIDRTGIFGLSSNTQNFKLDATNGQITAIAGTIGGWTINSNSMTNGVVKIAAGVDVNAVTGTAEAWFGRGAAGYTGVYLKGTTGVQAAFVANNSGIGSAGRPYMYFYDGTRYRVVIGELNTNVWDGSGTNSIGMKIWATDGTKLAEFSDVQNIIAGWNIRGTYIDKTETVLSAGVDINTVAPSNATVYYFGRQSQSGGNNGGGVYVRQNQSGTIKVVQLFSGQSGTSTTGSARTMDPHLAMYDGTRWRIVLGDLNNTWVNGSSTGYRASMGLAIWDSSGNNLVEFSDSRNAIGGWTISQSDITSTGVAIRSGASANIAFGSTPPTANNSGTGVFISAAGFYGLSGGTQQSTISATDGKFRAGAGKVVMDATGLAIVHSNSSSDYVGWALSEGGSYFGWVRGNCVDASIGVNEMSLTSRATQTSGQTVSVWMEIMASNNASISQFRIDSNSVGNVAAQLTAGTLSVNNSVYVSKSQASAATELRLSNTNASGFAAVYFNTFFGNSAGGLLQWNNTTGSENFFLATGGSVPLHLGTNNTARVTVLPTSGNVGIGTSSPDHTFDIVTSPGSDATTLRQIRFKVYNTSYTAWGHLGTNYDNTYFSSNTSYSGSAWVCDDTTKSTAAIIMTSGTSNGSILLRATSTNNVADPPTRLTVNGNGTITFNAYGAGTLSTDSSGNISASSDETLKQKVADFILGMDAVRDWQPISYRWKHEIRDGVDYVYHGYGAGNVAAGGKGKGKAATGRNTDGSLTLSLHTVSAVHTNALKELDLVQSSHEARIAELERQLDAVQKELRALRGAPGQLDRP